MIYGPLSCHLAPSAYGMVSSTSGAGLIHYDLTLRTCTRQMVNKLTKIGTLLCSL